MTFLTFCGMNPSAVLSEHQPAGSPQAGGLHTVAVQIHLRDREQRRLLDEAADRDLVWDWAIHSQAADLTLRVTRDDFIVIWTLTTRAG